MSKLIVSPYLNTIIVEGVSWTNLLDSIAPLISLILTLTDHTEGKIFND